ncbi:MAG: hypothetical protein OXC98_13115, partial [bacterium]|nr:hypothetical protein [bacterium]
MNDGTVGVAAHKVHVSLPRLAVTGATVRQLQDMMKATIRAQHQLAGFRAEVLREMRRRQGTKHTETVLQKEGLLPRRKARSEVETAGELEKLPKTREGLRKGEISYD